MKNKQKIGYFGLACLILAGLIFVKTEIAVIALGIMLLILLYSWEAKYFLFALLFLRAITDWFSQNNIVNQWQISYNYSILVGVIALAFSVLTILQNYKKTKTNRLLIPYLIFLTITALSLLASVNISASFTEIVRLVTIFSLAITASLLITNKQELLQLSAVMIFSAIIPTAVAYYQYATNTGLFVPFEGVSNRLLGTLAHPNLFAYFLIIPISLAVYFLIYQEKIFTTERKNKLFKIFIFIFLIISLPPFILSYTRGAWLALIITLFFVSIKRYKKFTFVILAVLIIPFFFLKPVQNRIENALSDNNSISWRLEYWQTGFKIAQNNLLLGNGPATAEKVMADKYATESGAEIAIHNDYLKILLDSGLLGLLAYLFLIVYLLYDLTKIYLNSKNKSSQTILLTALGLSLAIFTASFYDNIIRNTPLMWFYWVLVGVIVQNSD